MFFDISALISAGASSIDGGVLFEVPVGLVIAGLHIGGAVLCRRPLG